MKFRHCHFLIGNPCSRHCRQTYHLQILHSQGRAWLIYSQSTTNKMQRLSIYLFLKDALHASGGFSVHRQELKAAHTASGICQLAAGSSNGLTNA